MHSLAIVARCPKRIDVRVTHIHGAASSSLLFWELTSSAHTGAFFTELADHLRCLHLCIALCSMWGTTACWCGCSLGWAPLVASVRRLGRFRGAFPYVASLNVYLLYPQVWEAVGVRFVWVFYEGTVANGLEWAQLDDIMGRSRALVPDRLFEQCMGN